MSDPIVEAGLTSANRLSIAPEQAKLHMAVMVWQFSYAVNHVIIGAALNMGMSMLVLPVYRNIIALLLLLPFAYVLERYSYFHSTQVSVIGLVKLFFF